jgi:hypothetical protein
MSFTCTSDIKALQLTAVCGALSSMSCTCTRNNEVLQLSAFSGAISSVARTCKRDKSDTAECCLRCIEQGANRREGPFPPDDELAGTWEALSLDEGGQAILERRDVWGFPDAPDSDPPRNRGIRFG